MDCSNYVDVTIDFSGWFSVFEGYNANVQVSIDNFSWSDLMSVTEVCSGGWFDYSLDISDLADGNATVYVRWQHENVGGGANWAGMSVDNIAFVGVDSGSSSMIFSDGFESGDFTAWSRTVN